MLNFHFYTGGYEKLSLAKPWKTPIAELLSSTSSAASKHIKKEVEFDFVFNCTAPRSQDPIQEHERHLFGHWGQHTDTLKRTLKSRTFRKNVRKLKEALRSRGKSLKGKIVRVLWLCRQGRHRSLASSYLANVGVKRDGHKVLSVTHLQEDSWDGLCNDCPKCSVEDSPGKKEVKGMLTEFWDSV